MSDSSSPAEPGDREARARRKQARKAEKREARRRRVTEGADGPQSAGGARPPGPKRLAPPPSPKATSTEGPDSRRDFFDQAHIYAPVLGVETPSGSFLVSTGDRHMGKSLFVKRGRPEFRVLTRAATIIKLLTGDDSLRGTTFIDIGANIGTTTISALLDHDFARAVSCEPEPQNHRLLRANVILNGLEDQVSAIEAGASDSAGTAELVVHEESGGFSWIAVDPAKVEAAEAARVEAAAEVPGAVLPAMSTVEVEVTTLDRLAEGGLYRAEEVGLLWIDTEGHEDRVLAGGGELLEGGVPIVFEFDPEGQRERGDGERLHEIVETSHTHFVDVRRREADRNVERFRLRPIRELRDLAARFLDPEEPGTFTDVLLLSLDDEQVARGADLPDLFAKANR